MRKLILGAMGVSAICLAVGIAIDSWPMIILSALILLIGLKGLF